MFTRTRRAAMAMAGAGALAASLLSVPAAAAEHDVTPARIDGADRFDTAAQIAQLRFPDGADHVLLARADDFPDGLAAAPYAHAADAPLLLTHRDDLTERTATALGELGVEQVTILGGDSAVDPKVEAEVAQGFRVPVQRIDGASRHHTAANIARAVQDLSGNDANFVGGSRTAFVVNGNVHPDAVAAGAASAARPNGVPILTVEHDRIPEPTADVLDDLDFENLFLVGGPHAISEQVRDQLEARGHPTERLAGDTRTATAVEVAKFAEAYMDVTFDRVHLARGDDFADALTAGPLAGAAASLILLSASPSELSDPTAGFLAEQCEAITAVRAIGGTAAVTTGVLEAAEDAAEQCHLDDDGAEQTFAVTPQEAQHREPGEAHQFAVSHRYDGQDLSGPLDIALFPCDQVDQVEGRGHPAFHDENDDARADGIESTDTGSAVITGATGADGPFPTRYVRDASPDVDGTIEINLDSPDADCAVVVVFDDRDNNSALDLDSDGHPTEPYGVGKLTWQ